MTSDPYDTRATIRILHKYVRPGQRYAKLMGSWVALPASPAAPIPAAAAPHRPARTRQRPRPTALLGWREGLTAAWLAGIARRTELRDKIGHSLASEVPYAGRGFCIALALFGKQDDADLLITYLDQWLPRTDCQYAQADAIGALLHIDSNLGIRNADRFLAPGGLWQQWTQDDSTADPAELRWFTDQCCILVDSGTPEQATTRRQPLIRCRDYFSVTDRLLAVGDRPLGK